jgi:SAM-dependent methyltransferase
MIDNKDAFVKSLRFQIEDKWKSIDLLEQKLGFAPLISCPLCGNRGLSNDYILHTSNCIFLGGVLHRHQCPNCDVIFGPGKMLNLDVERLSGEYISHYQIFSEGDSTESELKAFHLLSPKREGIYLNYGAGSWSQSVQILNDQGWNVHGYDPHVGDLSMSADIPFRYKYDGVFTNNVIEHFRDPIRELVGIRSLLKPGGLMSHCSPCFEYCYEFTRFHLFFFPGRSRQVLLDLSGFIEEMYIEDGDFRCSVSSIHNSSSGATNS